MQVLLVYALGIGIWGLEVVKAEVTCDPPPVYNRTVIASGHDREKYPLGSNVTYRCDFGYASDVIIGSSRCILSKSNGKPEWTEPLIRCKPRSCGDPGFVSNAQRIGSLFTFPNSVQYECEDGYEIHGLSTRYCLASGSWSGTLPTCKKIHCGYPANPENGQAIYSSTEYEAEVKYRCNEGYSLSNKQPRICTGDGTWSGVEPVCTEGLCEAPVAPENGKIVIKPSVPRIGSIVSYACHDGFRLQGSESARCLETGEWTFPTPKCLHPCKIPDLVPHGKIGVYKTSGYYGRTKKFETISRGTSIKDGEFVLKCDSKYEVTGAGAAEGKVECRGGAWSDNLKCVPAPCKSSPPSTANGRVTRLSKEHGGTVVYSCNSDYRKTKTGNVTCHFGTWTGITPVCTDTRCRMDKLLFPGLVPGKSTFQHGESFLPSCVNGYRVAKPEDSRLSCQQGRWIGHMPPCTGERCKEPPPSIPNGHVVHYTGEHASIARYECEEFYILQQSQNTQVQCLFGEWKGRLPECKDSRCYLKDLRKKMGISLESREVTNHNGYLDVVCGREYTPTGEQPFCFKGKWNERVLSPCRERSCEISRIPNGVLTVRRLGPPYFTFSGWVRDDYYDEIPVGTEISSGHMRHLTCFDGYSVQGSGSSVLAVTCQKGEWYPNPVCLPHGVPYVEAVVTAVSTLKPSAPKTVTVAEVSSTEPNLKLSKTTTQPPTSSSTDDKEVDQPHTVSVAENNNVAERCYCSYNSPDKNLVAYAGNELLQNGNHVKFNCTVKFHCKEIGYYRLTGPKEITCTDCRPFHSAAYPECKEPVHGDTAIFFDENLKVMPDGNLSLIKGVTVRLTCLGNIRYPTWTFPESENTYTHNEAKNTDDGIVYTTLLDIVEASSEHDGKYNCAMEGYAPTTINIKVFDPDMRCPLLEEGNKFIIEYDRDRLPNSTAKFDCKKLGQKIIGANVLTCLMDGHWSAETPDCTDITCPEFEEFEEMVIEYSKEQKIGSVATFFCGSGDASGTSKCLETGVWSAQMPSCSKIRCPAFKESEDMLIEYTAEQRPGSVATFFCGKGDVYGTSKCLETGDWSASMPSCSRKEVLCPTLDETKFQVVYDGERKVDSQAKISCLTTLQKLNGSDVLRCLENGRWSHVPDCIDIECPAFEENEDMQIQYTQDRKVGSSANFHCFSPAVLSGKSTLKCLSNGEWSGNTPSCLRPSCSLKSLYEKLPEKIVIGQDQPNNDIPYGTNIPLACDDGLRPEGKAEAKCEEDQKWTIPRVRCVSGCGPIPKADNSQLIIEPEKEFYVFGESVIFSCPTGHSLTSELQLVVCISNTWSADEFPDCKNV